MPDESRNPLDEENRSKMKELAEVLNVILKKIEIKQIQREPNEDCDEYFDKEDFDFDGEQYDDDFITDLLFDVFEMVQGNVPTCYTGADVTTGMLGLIVLHNRSTVKLVTSLLLQVQMMQTQLMEYDREKIDLLKKQNELLEKLLNK